MKKTAALVTLLLVISLFFTSFAADHESFTLTPVDWDGVTIAKCAVPEGFKMQSQVNCSDETTCMGYPIRLTLMMLNEDTHTAMLYYCGESFIERVKSPVLEQKNGELDPQTAIIMMPYMNAGQYCDVMTLAWMNSFGAEDYKYVKDEDMSFYDKVIEARRKKFEDEVVSGMGDYGMKLDWSELTGAEKVYSFKDGGVDCYFCILSEVLGYQYTISGFGFTETNILWEVPAYYMMFCPAEDYQRIHDGAFRAFVENTTVNDEFRDINDQLNYSIRDTVIANMNMVTAASMAYAQAMDSLTTSMVESSLGSYNSDRFTDYMFDQNDYTLSDGSHVKVSTAYDYVYEGDYGTVYYSNSAFGEPGTRLYPNR